MIFPTHKEEVNKLNLKKLATDFVLDVPKRKKKFAVPDWNRLWFIRNDFMTGWNSYSLKILEFQAEGLGFRNFAWLGSNPSYAPAGLHVKVNREDESGLNF